MLKTPIRLLSWNVNSGRRARDLTAKIESVVPHIVTLQEVKRNLADDWAHQLKKIGLVHHYRSGDNALALPYQCLIASRWNLTPNDIVRPREPPYPESLGRTTVSVPGERDIDVFTAHIPNGSGHGWRKIDTLHALAAELRRANDSPRILTGDFNEPEWHPKLERIEVWGKRKGEPERWPDQFGDERPSVEWAHGVCSVLDEGASQHRLRNAYRVRRGPKEPTPVTHRTKAGKKPRCFDHAFVSRHFDVLARGYFHVWREREWSDHSPMYVHLRFDRIDRDWNDGLTNVPGQNSS